MRASIFRDIALSNTPLGGQAVAAPDESARDLTAHAAFDFQTYIRSARLMHAPRFYLVNELIVRVRRHARELGDIRSRDDLERFIRRQKFPPQLQGSARLLWDDLYTSWAQSNAARVGDEEGADQ